MKTILRVKLLCLYAGLLVVSGCGGSGLPPGETGTVSGTVTYNGAAVPTGCTVLFMGTEGGMTAVGTTDASGNYNLSMRDGSEILVGSYRVAVTPPKQTSTLSDEEIMERTGQDPPPETDAVEVIPAKYLNPETTPVTKEVKGGANTIDIELTD